MNRVKLRKCGVEEAHGSTALTMARLFIYGIDLHALLTVLFSRSKSNTILL